MKDNILKTCQGHINQSKVFEAIREFNTSFRDVYETDTLMRMYAVGPMASFLGFLVETGRLNNIIQEQPGEYDSLDILTDIYNVLCNIERKL